MVDKSKWALANVRILVQFNPKGNVLVPTEKPIWYVMAIKQGRSKVKRVLPKKLLSFCENILAN